jgi:homopolymeric O-antigen transport system permease protein
LSKLRDDVKEMLTELGEYRELILQMTKRDIKIRYKQAVMGFGWAVFTPLVNTVLFSVIFTRVAPIETPVPYPVFAYCGLWCWNFTASSLRFSTISLTSNINLVAKVYFPREVFPFSSVIVSLIDFLVGAAILVALLIYYRVPIGLQVLWLPAVLAVQVCFTAAIALLLSMANLFFRDVKYLFEVVITVWMFGTSVVYPLSDVGGTLGRLLVLNPMTPIVDAYRNVILLNAPPPAALGLAAGLSVVLLAFFWFGFHRAEAEFAENL